MTLRTDRVASLIKEEVGMLLSQRYQAAEYGLVTVTEVRVTPDLRIANIFISIMGDDARKQSTLRAIELDKKSIRSHLGANVRTKFTPEINFHLDDSLDRMEKIDSIIRKIHSSDSPG